jgi:hypothetical protein
MTFTTHYLRTPTGMIVEFRTGSKRFDAYPGARRSADGARNYVSVRPDQMEQERQSIRSFVRQAYHEDTIFDQ